MTYERFLNCLEQELLDQKEVSERIRRVQMLKNNGVKLDGFSYWIQERREQPTVYVNHYYKEEMKSEELEKTAGLILEIMRESVLESGRNFQELLDYEKIKEKIFYRLVSREKNEELLETLPYLPWLDLAIVFYIRVPEHIVKNATALIHTGHMKHWGLEPEELYRTAAENMSGIPVALEPLEQILEEAGVGDLQSGMYVLSNRQKEFGAAVIVDPQVQRMCARQLGGDYYVLPSSIHEVILLSRALAGNREQLDELVQEVNKVCVNQEEVLSGHAYLYREDTGKLEF